MFCLIIDLFGLEIDLKNISNAILYHLICATYHTVTLDLFFNLMILKSANIFAHMTQGYH